MQFGKSGTGQGEEWATAIAAFARACSIFLRKTVLGDFGRRQTRLLDDDVLEVLGLRFHRLVTIPRELRRPIRIELGGIRGGALYLTKLNDETMEPERTYTASMGPQTLEIVIQWPFPGALGWTGVPTAQQPWLIVPEMLFRLDQDPVMDCDEWLCQQVVHFDNRGISGPGSVTNTCRSCRGCGLVPNFFKILAGSRSFQAPLHAATSTRSTSLARSRRHVRLDALYP